MDRRSKVESELTDFADGVDAIFIEYPAEPIPLRTWIQILLRTPVLGIGAVVLQVVLYYPAYLLVNRDLLPTELVAARSVAQRDGVELHPVDDVPTAAFAAAGPKLIAANWLVVLALMAVEPWRTLAAVVVFVPAALVPTLVRRTAYRRVAIALAIGAVLVGYGAVLYGYVWTWTVLVSALGFLVVLTRSIGPRNETMLDRVQAHASEAGYDDAVLVTGKAHLPGLTRAARDRGIEVPAAHVSAWFREGETRMPVDPSALPSVGDDGTDDSDATPGVAVGSERAVFGKRVLAALIDGLATAMAVLLVLPFVYAFLEPPATELLGVDGIYYTMGAITLLAYVGYYTLEEARTGTTPGKRRFGLGVGRTDGTPIGVREALLRNLLRPLDALVCYALGGLVAMGSDRNRRIGDYLAGTVVGRRQSREHASAED